MITCNLVVCQCFGNTYTSVFRLQVSHASSRQSILFRCECSDGYNISKILRYYFVVRVRKYCGSGKYFAHVLIFHWLLSLIDNSFAKTFQQQGIVECINLYEYTV